MERELKITGEGKLSLMPDIAVINLPVVGEASGYEQAVNLLNKEVSLVHEILKKNGIEKSKLKTTDFRVYENWKPADKKNERIFLGFKATHDLQLELPLDNRLINAVLSDLTQKDAGISFSIRFDVSKKESYKKQLLQNAVADAMESAQTIADAAGIKLKEIVNINFSFSEIVFHNKNVLYESELNYTLATMPEFSPDEIDAKKNITIVWRIE